MMDQSLSTQTITALRKGLRKLFNDLGDDSEREGLQQTPHRWMRAMTEMTRGYELDPVALLSTSFDPGHPIDELISVKSIPFWSLCEHHLMPFHGMAAICYLPKDRIVGLSKIPRAVQALACRLQIQERMTAQIGEAIEEALDCRAVGVVIKAQHLCMAARGIKSDGQMETCWISGEAMTNPAMRDEMLGLLRS